MDLLRATLRWGNTVKKCHRLCGHRQLFRSAGGATGSLDGFIHEADEHGPNSAPYVVLSNNLWRSVFNSDPAVVGTTVRLDKDPYTVIGVAPGAFSRHGAI